MHWQQLGGIGECIEHVLEDYWRLVLVNCIGELYGRIVSENCMGEVIWEALWSSIGLCGSQILENKAVRKKMCCQKAQAQKHLTNSIPHRLIGMLHAVFNFFLIFGVYLFQLKPWKGNLRNQEKDKGQAPGRESKLLKPEIQQGLHPAKWLPSSSKIGLGAEYQFSMPRSLPTRLLQICNLLNAT